MKKAFKGKLEKIDEVKWRIPRSYMEGMRVDGIIYSDEKMIPGILADNAPQQVANAAHLPGITTASIAMPDIHWGYGLPIGGVVATDIDEGGVISPGGVGYDINCGVRLIRTGLEARKMSNHFKELADTLFSAVPAGVGSTGALNIDFKQQKEVMQKGALWALEKGYGWESDIEYSEENGAIKGADPDKISERASKRGRTQLGTLGSGNHFIEVQVVDEIYRPEEAEVFGLKQGLLTVMIHTGSRGFGHQVCTEYAAEMIRLAGKYGIRIPDKQLSCVPVSSSHGRDYLGAMRSAANFAWANRQVITHLVREAFEKVFACSASSMEMGLVYDVAHNIAKLEKYTVNGKERTLCVHRKGATRALGPGHSDLPNRYKSVGQPVIIPGDMGRYSYILAGTAHARNTFYSTCHGAGRCLSRSAAIKAGEGRSIAGELAGKGIFVRWTGKDTMKEEASEAYKDVSHVVDIVEKAGISVKVARMRPLAVVKG